MGRNYKIFLYVALAVVFAVSGCTSTKMARIEQLETQLAEQNEEIETLQTATEEKDETIQLYREQLTALDRARRDAEEQASMAMEEQKMPAVSPEMALLPPDAKPNECYARVFVPPVYKTYTERVLRRQASERLELIPAKYEWGEEKTLVREASQRLEVIPAKYEWKEEKILVSPATTRLEEVPAKFGTTTEKVLIKPAHTIWKKGRGLIEKVDNTTGEIMCLVEVPASYKTVRKRVMTSPPSTNTIEVPAQYKTVKKRVMVTPPETRAIEIPAAYQSVKVRKLVSAPEEKRIEIPAEYQTITKTELEAEGRMEWRRVLCETNMSPDLISRLQKALLDAEHDPGPIDGIIGRQTRAAMTAYQKEKGLAFGALTYRTLESLGVSVSR